MADRPPEPVHINGTSRGEELVRKKGKEPGRGVHGSRSYRTARDATSISPEERDPIDPKMPYLPPA